MNRYDFVEVYSSDRELLISGQVSELNEDTLILKVPALCSLSIGAPVELFVKEKKILYIGSVSNVSRSSLIIRNLLKKDLAPGNFIERRGMFKIQVLETCTATYIMNSHGDPVELDHELVFKIQDISIGGVGITTPTSLEVGMIFGFCFDRGSKAVDLDARILRKTIVDQTGHYFYGCQFVGMGVVETEILNGYIFKQQVTDKKNY